MAYTPSLNYSQTTPCKQETLQPLAMGHWVFKGEREKKTINASLLHCCRVFIAVFLSPNVNY